MKGDETEDETTLQCDPSDGIVVSVTNVQALVVRVPAYTLWIIELCLISSTIRKAFSCTSQSCDLLWCIYVSMAFDTFWSCLYLSGIFLYIFLVTYLQSDSRTPPAELCPLLPLSLPWRGALRHQLPMSSEVESLACHPAAQLKWNIVNHLWPFWGYKLRWYTFSKYLDELEEWAGEVQLHSSH